MVEIERRVPYAKKVSMRDLGIERQLLAMLLAEEINRGHLIREVTGDVEVENKREKVAKRMLKDKVGKKFETVRGVRREWKERSLSEEEKKDLLELEAAIFTVMDDDPETAERMILGQGEVDKVLPQSWKGAEVGKLMIKDGEVKRILKALDRKRRTREEGQMSDAYQQAVKQIDVLLDQGENDDAEMAAGFLYQAIAKVEGLMLPEQGDEGIDVNVLAGAVKDGVKEAIGGRSSPEVLWKQKKDFFQAMLLHHSPINMDPFSNMAPEWTANEDKPLLLSLIALSNVSYYKWRYGDANLDVMVDLRGEATFSATNEMMQKMYDLPGVRESMEFFVRDFFDLVSDPKSGVMILKLKGNGEVLERLQNITVTREEEMVRLREEGVVKDEMEAMMAVSTAFNLLYSSHVFESGDPERRMIPCEAYVEQMRAFMHPAMKARAKQIKSGVSVGTEEGWGGQLGQWLVGTLERASEKIKRCGKGVEEDVDVVFRRRYEDGEVHPFPERLFASFLVMTKVDVVGDSGEEREINLAEALHKEWRVDFEKVSKGGNPWGAYADTADSALKLYKACRGDEKSFSLPLGDPKGRSDVIDWAGRVADARNKLSKNDFLSPYVNTAEFVKWIIAACARGGLYPSAELVLMTPNVSRSQDISFDALFQSRDLVTRKEAKKIKRDFHADGYMSKWERRRIRGLSIRRGR